MKSVLSAIFTIALVSVLVGAGTFAYYTDTEVSSGNTLTADEMGLIILDDDESWRDGVTATWTMDNMKPGDSVLNGYVKLDLADGSLNADHMEIKCDYSVTEEDSQTESDTDPNTDEHPDLMATNMTITSATYDNGGVIDLLTGDSNGFYAHNDDWVINDIDEDGIITLYDLKYGYLDNLPAPDGDHRTFRMDVKFNENAGNEFQGDTLDLTVIFILNQDESQSHTPEVED